MFPHITVGCVLSPAVNKSLHIAFVNILTREGDVIDCGKDFFSFAQGPIKYK